MRAFLEKWFQSGEIKPWAEIKCFNVYHFLYLILIVGLIFFGLFFFKNKSDKTKKIVLDVLVYCFLISYILDILFITPIISGIENNVDLDKLPFHFCTFVSILVPFVHFNKKFGFAKQAVVAMAITSSMMYMTYPGSALGGLNFYSYKVRQTFFFHGCLMAWGCLTIGYGYEKLTFKKYWQPICLLVINILWAYLGNIIYNVGGIYNYNPGSGIHHYDWAFITGSFIPALGKVGMPFGVLGAVGGTCALLYLTVFIVELVQKKIAAKKAVVIEEPVTTEQE